jgi:Cu-Zn family superoxide dismutase
MKRLLPLCVAFAIVGCGQKEAPSAVAEAPAPEPAEAPAPEAVASAQVAPTQGNTAAGSLTLTAEDGGVRLTGVIQGLAPNGEFGFHIHEKGDCSAPDATSAGAHFNPAGTEHGNHGGDMSNVKSDAQGVAQVDARANGVTLGDGSETDVLGRAVVVHEKADDYTSQPAGNAGSRIACGVITAEVAPAPAG